MKLIRSMKAERPYVSITLWDNDSHTTSTEYSLAPFGWLVIVIVLIAVMV